MKHSITATVNKGIISLIKRALFCGVTLFLSLSIYAQDIEQEKIDHFIDYIEQNNRAVGSISIFKGNTEIYYRDFGQQNIQDLQFDKHTTYQIASISKMVTATLVFKLIEEKKLNLQDKLAAFFPDMPDAKKITIEQLLNHTSGLGDVNFHNGVYGWLKEREVTDKEMLAEIKKTGVLFSPGTSMSYSNSAYFLLGKIIEQKYQMAYKDILQNYIATPLNLHDFRLVNSSQNYFDSYRYTDNSWQPEQDYISKYIIGYTGISSTTTEMNKLIYALFHGKIISNESVELMKPAADSYFGRGMMKIPFYEVIMYGHGGDTTGSHTLLTYNEKNDLSIAMAINGNRSVKSDFYVGIFNAIYNGNQPYPLFISDDILNQYSGIYESADYPFKIKIYNDGGSLYGIGLEEEQIPFLLKPTSDTEFNFENHLQIKFNPADGTMLFKEGNDNYEFIKEKTSV